MHRSISLARCLMLLLAAFVPVWLFQPAIPADLDRIHGPVVLGKTTFVPREKNLNYSGCTAQSTAVVDADFEQEVVELVNAQRAAQGLSPLKRNPQLDEAARYHAADMKGDNYFNHDSYDRVNNQLQFACAWSERLVNFYTAYSAIGENIAWGYSTPDEVMEGWMNSSGHRENILSASYSEIGVGYYTGDMWVEDFGARSDSHPVIINNEAATTDSRNVNLFVYGSWREIRIHNDGDSWTAWMPFQNAIAWQLPDQAGSHTVTVEMRSGTGTETSSDEIFLIVGEVREKPGPKLYLPLLVSPDQ